MLVAALPFSGDSSAPDLSSLKSFLASHAQREAKTTFTYKVDYQAFLSGKPTDPYQESGTLIVGGLGALIAPQKMGLGEPAPPSEGETWFEHLCKPGRRAPWANPAALLGGLVEKVKIKEAVTPGGNAAVPDDRVLVFPLEAPRPKAKFWTFHTKSGEARLRLDKDGTPVGLEVIQAYEGRLSPHFGNYSLDRRETWTFSMDDGQFRTRTYDLVLHRQDWKHFFKAKVEVSAGVSK
jgi:hypothetical protein